MFLCFFFKCVYQLTCIVSGYSTVVEQLTHHPKVHGSNPDAAGTGVEYGKKGSCWSLSCLLLLVMSLGKFRHFSTFISIIKDVLTQLDLVVK